MYAITNVRIIEFNTMRKASPGSIGSKPADALGFACIYRGQWLLTTHAWLTTHFCVQAKSNNTTLIHT